MLRASACLLVLILTQAVCSCESYNGDNNDNDDGFAGFANSYSTNGDTSSNDSSQSNQCDLNLTGKTQRPRPTLTSGEEQNSTTNRKTKEQVKFDFPIRDDFRAQFTAIDLLQFWASPKQLGGAGGKIAAVSINEMPALAGEGVCIHFRQHLLQILSGFFR